MGSAALDPNLARVILGPDRAAAIKDYGLTAIERMALINSRANTLPELAGELYSRAGYVSRATAAEHDTCDLVRDPAVWPISAQALQLVVQRVISSLPTAAHSRPAGVRSMPVTTGN